MSSLEVQALQDLRKGSLYEIIATISSSIVAIFIVASLFVTPYLFNSTSPYSSSESIGSPSPFSLLASIGSLTGVIVLEIIALVFTILSVLKLRSGFRGLEAIGKDVGGVTGTTLLIIGIILAIVGIGVFIIIIGLILIGLAIRRVGQIYNVSNIRNGGILIAIGSIIPFAGFIGFILTYMGLGKLLDMMGGGGQPTSGPSQGATPTQQLPVYQSGQGYIYNNNGMAVVQLYSTQPAQLLSARIDGTTHETTSFNPNYLQSNITTQVTINFGPLMLTAGQTYKIIITALVGNQTIEIPVYVTAT